LDVSPWTGHAKRHHADAQLRRRTDAVRASVSGGRRRAHRSADRCEGDESGHRRRARALGRARSVLRARRRVDPRALLDDLSRTCVERAAFLVVGNVDAAPLPGSRRVRRTHAARATRIPHRRRRKAGCSRRTTPACRSRFNARCEKGAKPERQRASVSRRTLARSATLRASQGSRSDRRSCGNSRGLRPDRHAARTSCRHRRAPL